MNLDCLGKMIPQSDFLPPVLKRDESRDMALLFKSVSGQGMIYDH